MNNHETSDGDFDDGRFDVFDECIANIVKNSDLMVTDSGYNNTSS